MEPDRFRNLQRQKIHLHPRFNLVYGPNGQGKTNFLEAVACLGSLRSFRTAGKNDLIRHGEEMCRVSGRLLWAESERILSFSLDHRGRSQFIDDRRIPSPEEYLRSVGAVHFIPEDVGLVGGPPSWRRRILDRAVFETRPGYPSEYRRFLSALRQRNALFRKARPSAEEKEGWDRALAETGSWVLKRRMDLLGTLNREMAALGEILELGEGLHLRYTPSFEKVPGGSAIGNIPWMEHYETTALKREALADRILEGLFREREREKRSGHTFVGPHRDAVQFLLEGSAGPVDLARFGSQGQKRAAVLALKLALVREVAGARGGEWPLVILDDVASELDEARKKALTRIIREFGAQFLLSATKDRDLFFPEGEGIAWSVQAGALQRTA